MNPNEDNTLYRTINGIKYINNFPQEWIDEEIENCGPRHCINCLHVGTYKAIFIGYCTSCAELYDFERGNGLLETGKEYEGNLETSIWNTYLENVNLENLENNEDWLFDYKAILNNLFSNQINEEVRNELVEGYVNNHNNYTRFPQVISEDNELIHEYDLINDINLSTNDSDSDSWRLPSLISDSDESDLMSVDSRDADSEEYYHNPLQ
jgi:hypothetical protein